MNKNVEIFLRTLETNFPSLQDTKFRLRRFYLNTLKIPFERDFNAITLFPDIENRLYLDVGGNRGLSIDGILMKKQKCHIQSFEPNPLMYKKLIERFGTNKRVTIHNFGLGNETGEFTLYIPFYRNYMFDGLASFDKECAKSWLKCRLYKYNERFLSIREANCLVKRLDDLRLNPFFIKLDIQSYELPALLGAEKTLEKSKPILLIEAVDKKITEYLMNFGYKQYAFKDKTFVCGGVGDLNTFFMTDDKYLELDLRKHI